MGRSAELQNRLQGRALGGQYELVTLIGSGGFADVYQAFDRRSREPVAIKVLYEHMARDPEVVKRFAREARVASQIVEQHVVRLLDTGQDAGTYFIVMELVEGSTLYKVLSDGRIFTPDEIIDIGSQALSGLEAAHAIGVVHRDVKPANLILTAEGLLKVMDFGIAKVSTGATQTRTGLFMGTPEYMAPEQVDNPSNVDARTDLYSLGVTLYELLVGVPPFRAETPWATLAQHMMKAPPPPRDLRPDTPVTLQAVLLRSLEKLPENRFQTAHDMRLALEGCLRPGQIPTLLPPLDAESAPTMGAPALPRTPEIGALMDRLARPVDATMPGDRGQAAALTRPVDSTMPAGLLTPPPTPISTPTPAPAATPTGAPAAATSLSAPPTQAAARLTPPGVPAPAPAASPARRNLALPLLAAGLVGAAIVVGILLYLRPSAVATDPVPTPAPAAVNPATTPATAPAVVTQPVTTAAATPAVTSTPAATSTAAPTATPGAAQRLENAKRLLDDGKADQALPLLEAIRQTDPTTPGLDETLVRAYVNRGQVALDQGDLDGSSAMFEKALTVRGDDENALTGRKRVEARRAWTRMEAAWGKDDDAVVEALEAVRRNDPQYRSADVRDKLYVVRLGRAESLQKAGDLEGAAAEYQRAVEVDPDRPEAKLRLQALTPTPTPVPPTATPVPYVPPAAPASRPQTSAPASKPQPSAPASKPQPSAPAPAPEAPAPSAPRPVRTAPGAGESPL